MKPTTFMFASSQEGDECSGCELRGGRRAFLRETASAVVAVAALLGIPEPVQALATGLATPLDAKDGEAVYPLPAADGVTFDKKHEVILVRWQGTVYAFRLSCPHQNTALKWKGGDGRFQCPKHKSKYQPDGAFVSGRATRGMDRYAVRRKGNDVVVELSRVFQEDKDLPGWKAAAVTL